MTLPTLDELAAQAETMPREDLPNFLVRLAQIEGYARARLKAPTATCQPNPDEPLTFKEAARESKLSRWYLQEQCRKGGLRHVVMPGGKIKLILRRDLAAFIEAHRA